MFLSTRCSHVARPSCTRPRSHGRDSAAAPEEKTGFGTIVVGLEIRGLCGVSQRRRLKKYARYPPRQAETMAPALLKAVTLATCVITDVLYTMRREPPLVVARVPGPGDDGPLRLRLRGLLLWSAFARGGLRRAAGGPLLRLHVTGIVGRRACGRRGGLPRVAQVPRVHLRADQVRLGRRVPLSPFPGLVRGVPRNRPRPLPRRRRGVVFGTGPVFAEGYQRNALR